MATTNTSDEDDYMSDTFLREAKNVNPGLDKPSRLQRELDQWRKRDLTNAESKTKPVRQREHEHRECGLQQTISAENKGFAMLQKMGYKAGTGLGKSASGRVEPIPMQFKTGRSGVGRDSDQKRKQEMLDQCRQKIRVKKVKWDEENRENYRERMSSKFQDKANTRDLRRSQKACAHLDSNKGIEDPKYSWYWPDYMFPATEEFSDEDETEEIEPEDEDLVSDEEKLTQLTFYLRSVHFYCIWCGTSFNDDDDLLANCPGDTASTHGE